MSEASIQNYQIPNKFQFQKFEIQNRVLDLAIVILDLFENWFLEFEIYLMLVCCLLEFNTLYYFEVGFGITNL